MRANTPLLTLLGVLGCVGDVPNRDAGPTVTITSPDDGERFSEGDRVSFVATASDAETAAGDLIATWESDLDGLLDEATGAADGTILFETTALSPGEHTVTLTVTDEDGLDAVGAVLISVSDLPDALTARVSPANPGTDDTLTASVSGPSTDAEGEPIPYAYAWTRDGAATAYASTTGPAAATTRGEVWAVTVTPEDGGGPGEAATASVTIRNTAPSAPGVEINPEVPEAGVDDIWCGVTAPAGDDDGDTLSYTITWTKNGSSFTGTTTTVYTNDTVPTTALSPSDTFTCSVTATDGSATSAAATDSVSVLGSTTTIGNATPFTTWQTFFANTFVAMPITVSSTVTLYSIGTVHTYPSGDMMLAVYTDSGSAPGTLVAQTAATTVTAGAQEVAITAGSVLLPAGSYWIVGMYDEDSYPTTHTTTLAPWRYTLARYSSGFSTTAPSTTRVLIKTANYYIVVR